MCEMWGDRLSDKVTGKVQNKSSGDKHLTAPITTDYQSSPVLFQPQGLSSDK